MAHFDFDRFYRYAELTSSLQALALARPDLVSVASIGKSHEGRDIWVATVTKVATGPAHEKPAFWVDGNIHSTEVSASAANLYLLNHLVEQYGVDEHVTRALDTRAFYICPRINPDGAEWALADSPRFVRSSIRTYPFMEDAVEGFDAQDINGDGKILRMRIKDAHGHWKKHIDDPRVMVRRDPAESGGEYYRLLPEGRFVTPGAFDGTRLKVNKPRQGIGPPDALDYSLLVGALPGQGEGAIETQFIRANIDPTERYVQSPPGSTQFRVRPWETGFSNLLVAGDWTYTGLNVGSVECAVMSGRLVSNAITGSPPLSAIPGYPTS